MGKMRDAGVTAGKMWGKVRGITHSLPTSSVIAVSHRRTMSAARF